MTSEEQKVKVVMKFQKKVWHLESKMQINNDYYFVFIQYLMLKKNHISVTGLLVAECKSSLFFSWPHFDFRLKFGEFISSIFLELEQNRWRIFPSL